MMIRAYSHVYKHVCMYVCMYGMDRGHNMLFVHCTVNGEKLGSFLANPSYDYCTILAFIPSKLGSSGL